MKRRSGRIASIAALLAALAQAQCQWLGGFDDFEGGAAPAQSQCAALPLVKEDALRLGLMSRIDIPGAACFWIDQKEVTVEDYQRWQADVPADAVDFEPTWCAWKQTRSDPIGDKGDVCAAQILPFDLQPFAASKPMRCVDFCDAEGFCRWSGKHLCHSTDAFGVQGPRGTVREWLLACSNSLSTAYPFGNEASSQFCNIGQTADNCITSRAVCGVLAVGEKAQCKTATGVSDLLGNVAEWVYSCNLLEPGQDTPTGCLVRGGGYDDPLQACVQETTLPSDTRRPSLGFRCCADLSPDEELQLANVSR